MAIRLNFIVEGQTEETFVNGTLKPYLAERSIWGSARSVTTASRGGVRYRGGINAYSRARRDILRWTRQDRNQDARFTTMFDLYGLPGDFPGQGNARLQGDPYRRVKILEDALEEDIGDERFIPYLQLHEFEALLLSRPLELSSQFDARREGIGRLAEMVTRFESPELITDGADTAPSKRIIGEVPEYQGLKATAGPIVAARIGLAALRSSCGHFGHWLDRLESLGQ